MSAALAADEHFAERFNREARTMAALTHPNIAAIYDVGSVGHNSYIALELLPGGTLEDRLKQSGPLSPQQAADILGPIASALDHAHQHGIIHRDLKPENILFRADGTPVLTDFGIAKAATSATKLSRTGTSIGTPHYMSPEQAKGEQIDGRADQYSLGVVLYEALTRSLPFDAPDTYAIGIKHITEAIPQLPPHLSHCQPVIDRMLAKDRNERFASIQQAIDNLRNPAGVSPPKATRVVRAAPASAPINLSTGKAGSRSGLLLWAGAGAAAAGVLVVALLATGVLRSGATPMLAGVGSGGKGNEAETASEPPQADSNSIEKPVSAGTKDQADTGAGTVAVTLTTEPTGLDIVRDGQVIGQSPMSILLSRNNLPYSLAARSTPEGEPPRRRFGTVRIESSDLDAGEATIATEEQIRVDDQWMAASEAESVRAGRQVDSLVDKFEEQFTWIVEARLSFEPIGGAVKAQLVLPEESSGFRVLEENFSSRGYRIAVEDIDGRRTALWSQRRPSGRQALFYRATLVPTERKPLQAEGQPPLPPSVPHYEEPYLEAVNSVLEEVRSRSDDVATFASMLLQMLNNPQGNDNIRLMLEGEHSDVDRVKTAIHMLAGGRIPARLVRGITLQDGAGDLQPTAWLEAHNGQRWVPIDPSTGNIGYPDGFLKWWEGSRDPATVTRARDVNVRFASKRSDIDALEEVSESARGGTSAFVRQLRPTREPGTAPGAGHATFTSPGVARASATFGPATWVSTSPEPIDFPLYAISLPPLR